MILETHGPEFDGNSILIKLDNTQKNMYGENVNKYVFVGWKIYEFTVYGGSIVKYVSEVGNSDVPYAYAVNSRGEIYLMTDEVVLRNVPEEFKNDPYRYYYDYIHNIIYPLQPTLVHERLD